MKVTETITRDCCVEGKDLLPIEGAPKLGSRPNWFFCKHCGQIWETERFTDAAGGSDWRLKRAAKPWALALYPLNRENLAKTLREIATAVVKDPTGGVANRLVRLADDLHPESSGLVV